MTSLLTTLSQDILKQHEMVGLMPFALVVAYVEMICSRKKYQLEAVA